MPRTPQLDFIDLNILPEEYRPRVISPAIMLIWTIAIVLFILTLPTFGLLRYNQVRLKRVSSDLHQAQQILKKIRTPNPEVVKLSEELSQALQASESIQLLYPTINAQRRNWPQVFAAILNYDDTRIRLLELAQNDMDLTLTGLALSQNDVLQYAQTLDQSGAFERVIIESMESSNQLFASPTPLTAPSPSPATPAATATPRPQATATSPIPQDPYEPDDGSPKPILAGTIQRHSFYPPGDVDQVTFLGKAGKRYCIQAIPQVQGVDPVLEVRAGGFVYTNDNCISTAGTLQGCQCPSGPPTTTLAALVELPIPLPNDRQVIVRITNQGTFNPESWYILSVSEVSSAPSGEGDIYEPDDNAPKPISPGEKQLHTFYPQGDIDRVEFTVRAGYTYQVRTYNLASGVDTILSAVVDGILYQNDNASDGDPGSMISFTAPHDGKVGVAITNRGIYAPESSYWLTLTELAITPTPTVGAASPTPTPTTSCGDEYEPDDSVGRPIAPGMAQDHTFCPSGDIDRAVFTAKAGHAYRVETTNLAPGVDTFLSVQLDSHTASNDDRSPQDKSSSVEVQSTSNADTPAFITVSNKGLFGPDKSYRLVVTDLGSTDEYEPDDINGIEILMSVPQARAFSPAGDVDKVYFMAVPQHIYRIYTMALAPGVDTVLTLDVGTQHLTNDDRSAGDPSSYIEFQNRATSLTRAFVTIHNKGEFGPHKSYIIQVDDLGEGDPYEPDDSSGVPIAIGERQQRVFYPDGDIDKVYFTAAPYHRYRIRTDHLSPLVDTILSVQMGTTYLANDDRVPGDLSSQVDLLNNSPNNQQVSVTVTNKGRFGVDKTYSIVLEDLGSGQGDDFEPDLTTKRYISVGSIQRHTFYPESDIDQVYLTVQAGKRYAVMTCGSATLPGGTFTTTTPFSPVMLACDPLPPGIDTVIVATGPIHNCEPSGCQNDDALPSSGYTNSRVEFEARQDGEVTIRVYNKGSFDPSAAYYLRVHEIEAWTPTPTLTPSATPTLTPPPPASPTPTAYPGASPTPTNTPGGYSFMPSEPHHAQAGSSAQIHLLAVHRQATTTAEGTLVKFILLLRMGVSTP